jgi:hypothetical protein
MCRGRESPLVASIVGVMDDLEDLPSIQSLSGSPGWAADTDLLASVVHETVVQVRRSI